ncbi:MAG: hypothetical protein ACRCVV_06455 [Shewanella sp.]
MISKKLSLLACLVSITSFANDVDGFTIAKNLNIRYNNVVENCNGEPGYMCSGVMIRGVKSNPLTGEESWHYSESSQKRGSVSFSFLRKDILVGTQKIYGNIGIIFDSPTEAAIQNLPYEIYCMYPVSAATNLRDRHGCGYVPNGSKNDDFSTCLEVGVNSAEEWIELALSKEKSISNACSFSSKNVDTFLYNIKAQNLISGTELDIIKYYNEFLVKSWDMDKPEMLPIEAFWFREDDESSLEMSKYNQIKYLEKTGEWIPVIMMSRVESNPFTFRPEDQGIPLN